MDVLKIGAFIAMKRKSKNLTQAQLADMLHVTDRAVSKWECGRSLPDSSIMLELCSALGISVNELLTGEELKMEDYNKQAEANLLEITKEKEEADKRLLNIEIVIGITGTVALLSLVITGALGYKYGDLPLWALITMMAAGFVIFIIMVICALKIEQKAGYYECRNCHYKYVPSYSKITLAMHMGRTRYMKCPECGKKTWQKKVISKR